MRSVSWDVEDWINVDLWVVCQVPLDNRQYLKSIIDPNYASKQYSEFDKLWSIINPIQISTHHGNYRSQ